jgi:hypothetical protein
MTAVLLVLALMPQVPATIVTVAQGSRSALTEARETVARTASEWQTLWKQHGGTEPAAAVDFGKEMVAAVFLGTRATGGYSVEILSTRRDGEALVIDYAERAPGRDSIVTQALTSPFHIVRLPRHAGAVRFRSLSPDASGR